MASQCAKINHQFFRWSSSNAHLYFVYIDYCFLLFIIIFQFIIIAWSITILRGCMIRSIFREILGIPYAKYQGSPQRCVLTMSTTSSIVPTSLHYQPHLPPPLHLPTSLLIHSITWGLHPPWPLLHSYLFKTRLIWDPSPLTWFFWPLPFHLYIYDCFQGHLWWYLFQQVLVYHWSEYVCPSGD